MVILFFLFSSQNVEADLYLDDGKVYNINYTISDNIKVDLHAYPKQTTVNLLDGGRITGWLQAFSHSQINVYGGSIDQMLQAYGYSQVNMLGGSIGLFGFSSDNQGYVSGGSIGSMDTAGYGSLYFSEGTIANAFFAQRSSQVYFSGGSIGRDLYVFQQGHVTVSGGSIGQNLVTANDGIITINGSGFAIDGQAVGYGELTSIYGGSYWGDEPVRHLTGRLTSGELLDNDFYIGGNSKIELVYTEVVPVPSAVILGSLGLTFSGWLLKRKRMI